MQHDRFLAGKYLRLSKEDRTDKQGKQVKQSESIENQDSVIDQYLENHKDIELVDVYIDDGATGLNYDRDDFQRMMSDIASGRINTIITKDLSRLGRDQVETSRLLKKDFVIRKIRYIAVNDNVDTFSHEKNDIIIPFKILVNDFYSQDMSTKIRSTFNSKRKNGDFIGAFAPFGYQKDPNNNSVLIPDEEAAQVVRRIFYLFLQGYGKMKIARTLNAEGVSCPTEYKQRNNYKYHNSKKLDSTYYWTYSTVNTILKNEVYIGNMVQHKQEKIAYNLKQHKSIPKDQQMVVRGTHPPIIDLEVFNTIQKLLTVKTRTLSLDDNITMYAGILKCGDCKRRLAKTITRYKSKESVYYKCGSYKQYGKNVCSAHSIREDIINEIVLNTIKDEAKLALEQKDIDIMKKMSYNGFDDYNDKMLKNIQSKVLELQQEKSNMLRMLAKEVISEEDYMTFQNNLIKEQSKYQELEIQWKDKQVNKKRYIDQHNTWLNRFINYVDIEEVTRDVLISLIDEINVYEDKEIEIAFKFKSPLIDEF